MSGHSKWSTIKHKKAINDAKKGKIFSKLSTQITHAARQGGGDSNMNPNLRLYIDKAKSVGFPIDRIEKAEIYSSILNNNKSIEIISNYQQSKVCWRYSILIDNEDNLIDISDKIRLNGFHVSNLYWPVNFFFNSNDICVNAYTFARRIINFWVDKSIDKKYVEACSKSLIKHMNNIK